MNTLIIEDEKLAADNLIKLLAQIDSGIKVLGVIETVQHAVAWFRDNPSPQLIFLDVHLADDICFKIFDYVDVKTPVIFTTAYDQYALRAFKLNSIDYLLKPIDREELRRGIQKFKDVQHPDFSFNPAFIAEAFASYSQPYQKRFIVTSGERIKSVEVREVAYFFGHDKYVYLVTHQGSRYLIDNTLAQLEELLHPDDFFRINRQFIVGFKSIKSMHAYSRGRIKVALNPNTKEESIVSIDRSGSFKRWLNR